MKYSVIIPVYNAEKTLRRCVDSLLGQRHEYSEIILIDDGSKDGSLSICEEYALADRSVKLISQQNGGVSAARNAGLDAAQGEYVLFVDSDDYVAPDLFSTIDRLIDNRNADWFMFSGCVDNGSEKHDIPYAPFSGFSREELMPFITDAICRKTINGPWAKLYKRELIEEQHVRFPLGASVGEDRAFNIVYSLFINSCVRSDYIGYVLNTENDNSLSRKRHTDLQKQFEIADHYIEKELSDASIPLSEKDCYRKAINFGVCRSVYHDAKLLVQDGKKWLDRQKCLMDRCRIINKKRMKYPKTRYCTLIMLPVRLYLTPVIDAAARRQTRS